MKDDVNVRGGGGGGDDGGVSTVFTIVSQPSKNVEHLL